jgi:TRAP-type C4-dicarboxylate transport system permease large subunit
MINFITSYLPGILMLLVFLLMMAGMYTRKISALLALPLMALLFALIGVVDYMQFFLLLWQFLGESSFKLLLWSIALWIVFVAILAMLVRNKKGATQTRVLGIFLSFLVFLIIHYSNLLKILDAKSLGKLLECLHWKVIINDILSEGAFKLHKAYTVAFFGGMLAVLVKEKKIAETFIKYAAELAGDNPVKVALVMMFVCFLLFTTLGGLGAIIMIGTIILPIMMSLGIQPLVAGGILLIGLCAGGTFNPGNWAMYEASLQVDRGKIQIASLVMIVLYLLMGAVFVILNLRGKRRRRYFAVSADAETEKPARVHPIALFSPILPILLVFRLSTFAELTNWVEGWAGWLDQVCRFLKAFASFWDTYIGAWEFIPAFTAGILLCLIATWDKRGNNIRILTKSLIEGAESVMPAVLLMIGIGMLLNAVWNQNVGGYLQPLIRDIIPRTRISYILIFGLCAPLALYRGPLNLWGLGLGIATLIYKESPLSAAAVMGIFMTTGVMQGVCDPTNTHNVWIATYIGEDVIKLTKKLILYVWVMIFIGLFLMSILFPFHKTGEENKKLEKKSSQLQAIHPQRGIPV